MNPYPTINAGSDTGGLDLKKVTDTLGAFTKTSKGIAVLGGAALVGAMIGGKKHRVLGGALGVGALVGLLYVGSPLG